MDKPQMRYCLKLDKAKYYYRIDPITATKIIANAFKNKAEKRRKATRNNHKIAAGNAAPK